MKPLLALVFGLVLFLPGAEARVFDFGSEGVATYVRGLAQTSAVGDSPYGDSSGTGVTTNKKSQYNYGGEIGVLFSGKRFNVRIGAELVLPQHFSDVSGTSSGTKYFDLDTETLVITPMLNVEYLWHRSATAHAMIGYGVGYAFVNMENKYTMTPTGTTALGIPSMDETGTAQVPVGQIYLGYETLFTDVVTAMFDLGYKYAPVSEIKSASTTTGPSGSETKGQPLLNMDGSHRKMDLGGAFVGMSFRFYFGL